MDYTTTINSKNTINSNRQYTNTTNVDTTIHICSSYPSIYGNSLLYHYPVVYYNTTNHNDDTAAHSTGYTPTVHFNVTTLIIITYTTIHPENTTNVNAAILECPSIYSYFPPHRLFFYH